MSIHACCTGCSCGTAPVVPLSFAQRAGRPSRVLIADGLISAAGRAKVSGFAEASRKETMRHARELSRSSIAIAVVVLALGAIGVAPAGAVRHTSATKVTVTFTDKNLAVSRGSVQAGPAVFVVVNNGQQAHALAITGPGLGNVQTPKLGAGKSATLNVTLRMGSYMLADRVALGTMTARWVLVSPATTVTSTGQRGGGKTSTLSEDPNWWMQCD